MCIATPLANERVIFPLYTGQITIAILVVLEGFVESGKADALEHYSCFHGAKVIRFDQWLILQDETPLKRRLLQVF